MGINFGTTAFILQNRAETSYKGFYFCSRYYELLDDGHPVEFPTKNERCATASTNDFKKIPSWPIVYWASETYGNIFVDNDNIYEHSISEGQNITADNDKYLRYYWEINKSTVAIAGKWTFYAKGGAFRKWFGNVEYVIDWSDEARNHYHKHPSARIIPKYLRFREGITWTLISSAQLSFRILPAYATFDKTGSSIFFTDNSDLKCTLLFLNSKLALHLTEMLNGNSG